MTAPATLTPVALSDMRGYPGAKADRRAFRERMAERRVTVQSDFERDMAAINARIIYHGERLGESLARTGQHIADIEAMHAEYAADPLGDRMQRAWDAARAEREQLA